LGIKVVADPVEHFFVPFVIGVVEGLYQIIESGNSWSRSSSCRHSWFFNPPLGRFHSSNSQTVRAISVTGRAENSRAVWRINSSSLLRNLRPQKVRDSGMS
jgi:hypothetical protein